jgi:hypothetical protein
MRFEPVFTRAIVAVPFLVAVAACSSSNAPAPAPAASRALVADQAADRVALGGIRDLPYADACGHTHGPSIAHCNAKIRVNDDGSAKAAATPSGYTPSQLTAAYALTAAGGSGKTVAIVDAYDDPNAESDLAVYRTQFGLPACTSANGCFKKVGETGSTTSLPSANASWAEEISLDLDMVSAACPSCNILLVEANSASYADLGSAVNEAATLGASAISNSYSGSESSSDTTYSTEYYNHPGVLIAASAGDSGYGAGFPATSQYVLAVGGTTLTTSSSSRGWAEAAWADTGSGCSAVIGKPSWQTDSICGNRVEADVSAVADPNTGVAVYDTYGGVGGWLVFGGTSVASPFVTAAFTRLGLSAQGPSYVWGHTTDFFDVTTGSNGSCSPAALCTAEVGYDGPTGWGTPNGAALGGPCTPACSGKSCGADGCGGSCGTCATGDTCNGSGQCVTSCTPSCSGKTCGPDGCGGTCGTCGTGETCSTNGTCTCTPDCSGKSCGSDGCGGTCGTCPSGDTCSASGTCGSSGTCAHSECSTGRRLKKGCDTCATDICDADPYCCRVTWDSICVGEAGSICGESCN